MWIRMPRVPAAGAFVLVTAVVLSVGCAVKGLTPASPISPELYASGAVYLYQPLNPTTIWVRDPKKESLNAGETLADVTSPLFREALLRDLDTETLRISLSRISGRASATVAVVGTSVKGESYVLTVDYIKYFTSNQRLKVTFSPAPPAGRAPPPAAAETRTFEGNIPIYAGVGVRIRAEFLALESGVNVSGLPALAVAASGNTISGRLTVQTLGVTGPEITGLMPIISDISVSSIQSAVQAVAAIKAKLYDDSTVAYPKIVGFEAPTQYVDAIPQITEALYGLELEIFPRVSPNPMNPANKLLWISWFENGEVPAGASAAAAKIP